MKWIARRVLVLLVLLAMASTHAAPGSWSSTGPFGASRSKIEVDPSNPDVIYAAAALSGLFKTTNAGLTWEKSDTGLAPAPIDVEVDPNNPMQVFAVASDSVFRSTDGGLNWFAVGSGISGQIFDLTISTTLPTTIYAAGGDGVFKSTTLGTSWSPINTGLAASPQNVFPIEVDPSNGDRVLVGQVDAVGDSAVYETTTGGTSWSLVPGPWPVTEFVRDIAFGPGPTTYVAGDFLYSQVGIGAWTTGSFIGQFSAIDAHPTDAGRVIGAFGFSRDRKSVV